MNLEVRSSDPTETSELIASLPKPLDSYPPGIQLFIKVAGKQPTELPMQQALLTYAVYAYSQLIPDSYGQRAISQLSIEEISHILSMSKQDVEKHIRLIETDAGIAEWTGFEQDIDLLAKNSREEHRQQIRKLYKEGLNRNEIADQLNVSLSTVNRYLRP